MRRFALAIVVVIVGIAASEAHAAVSISYKDYPVDYTPGGPTPVMCQASASANQKCRRCHENIPPNYAQPYWVCVATTYNAECRCKIPVNQSTCSTEGECWYIG